MVVLRLAISAFRRYNQRYSMKQWTTRLQVNAIIALIVLGTITWRLLDIIRANDLQTHESQILGGALITCVGGIVYVVKLFATDRDDGTGDNGR